MGVSFGTLGMPFLVMLRRATDSQAANWPKTQVTGSSPLESAEATQE
jgi:hypothetical protein